MIRQRSARRLVEAKRDREEVSFDDDDDDDDDDDSFDEDGEDSDD